MSSTRQPKRAGQDKYATPLWAVERLAEFLKEETYGVCFDTVVDLGAGDGRIGHSVKKALTNKQGQSPSVPRLILVENEPPAEKHRGVWKVKDYLKAKTEKWNLTGRTVFVSNPPFSKAAEFVTKTAEVCERLAELSGRPYLNSCAMAFLLRLNWLGSLKRSEWLRAHPPDSLLILVPRPSFTNGGTDNCEYAWIVWAYGTLTGRLPGFSVLQKRGSTATKEAKE